MHFFPRKTLNVKFRFKTFSLFFFIVSLNTLIQSKPSELIISIRTKFNGYKISPESAN